MTHSGNFVVSAEYARKAFSIDISTLSNEVFYCMESPFTPDNVLNFNTYIQERRILKKPAIYIIYTFNFMYSTMKWYPRYTVVLDYTLTFKDWTKLSLVEMKEIENNVKEYARHNNTEISTSITFNYAFLHCSGYWLSNSIRVANIVVEGQNKYNPVTETDITHTCNNCVYRGELPDGIVCNAMRSIPDEGILVKNDCTDWEFLNKFYRRFNEQLLNSRVREKTED